MNSVEIKICGLNRRDDAAAALDLGADYIGFVLYAGSARFISGIRLAKLLDGLSAEKKAIGVFVNESRAVVEKIASDCNLFAIQLNGNERAEEFVEMTVPVWRSVRFLDGHCSPLPGKWPASRYVVDSAIPGLYGGTGKTADWKKAARFASRHPTMLAGGLTPGNVAIAILVTRPAGVDVSSGVERNPRRKDRAKMKAFIERSRAEYDKTTQSKDIGN
ncbi:MAG: phosphoribosylanthranilate isomerase [bacterium]